MGITALDLPMAVGAVLDAAATPGFVGYVTVTGVHGVMESQDDPALKDIHNRSFLSVPDGTPTVWVGRHQGHRAMSTVRGADLMNGVLDAGVDRGVGHYFYGGGDGVVETLAQVLADSDPAPAVVGIGTPPFRPLTDDEELELVADLNRVKPHLLWVGLSTPKQERFMAGFLDRHRDELDLGEHGLVLLGVGAAFDFKAGLVAEAPAWVQGTGMEWAYRLAREPKRLWRRYARNNPRFVAGVVHQRVRPQDYPRPGAAGSSASQS